MLGKAKFSSLALGSAGRSRQQRKQSVDELYPNLDKAKEVVMLRQNEAVYGATPDPQKRTLLRPNLERQLKKMENLALRMEDTLARFASMQAILVEQQKAADEAAIQQAILPLADHQLQQAREWQNSQNAQARSEFIAQCGGLLSSHEVADLLVSRAKNRAALASQLKDKQKIFSLRLHGQELFPCFQFDVEQQQVWPEIADIIAALQLDYEPGWQLALWFSTENAWLAAGTPLALWPQQRARVVAAAQAERATFA